MAEPAVDEAVFTVALTDAIGGLQAAEVPYLLIGGLASAVCGRERWTADIDVFVRKQDAERALAALADAGFETELTNPQWIYKAERGGIGVDVIFWLKGNIVLDDEMLERAVEGKLMGVNLRSVSPEDLLVMKAIANDEQSPRHWGDALGLIAACELDWDYVRKRARLGPRRVLALLTYAESEDLLVPIDTIRALFHEIYGAAE
jgi:predicted nucleotidyltransferase